MFKEVLLLKYTQGLLQLLPKFEPEVNDSIVFTD